jgi:ornithine cyclodeaminase
MKILSVEELTKLIKRHGLENFLSALIKTLCEDFGRWQEFTKVPRPAMHVPGGVLELMPICDNKYYGFKYVNCHPKNPELGLQTVVATGQLSRIDTGYPLMFSEMTVLTALRTAGTSALATGLLARADAKIVAILGTGAQSEFQIKGLLLVRDITEVRFFDIDAKAMDKFEQNMSGAGLKLVRCCSAEDAVNSADIVTVCTACKAHVDVIKSSWIKPGVHINALGGDCPGKTELEIDLLPRCKVVVEYFDQSIIEGEIQRLSHTAAKKLVYAELWELISGNKKGRASAKEITLFDSVGIALEDFSALRLTYELAIKYNLGADYNFTPVISDPKDLISICVQKTQAFTVEHPMVWESDGKRKIKFL